MTSYGFMCGLHLFQVQLWECLSYAYLQAPVWEPHMSLSDKQLLQPILSQNPSVAQKRERRLLEPPLDEHLIWLPEASKALSEAQKCKSKAASFKSNACNVPLHDLGCDRSLIWPRLILISSVGA